MRTVAETPLGGFPLWLTVVASGSLVVSMLCAAVVAVDVARRPQRMRVMNIVWPVSMLFGGLLWLALYRRHRRASAADAVSTPLSIAVGSTHCGAGCALGDLIAEFAVATSPALAGALGFGTVFAHRMFAGWILDFVVAYLLGIGFQYFAIAPMRGLSLREGVLAAMKADTLSITAWQIGMYGVMALLQLGVVAPAFGGPASVFTPEFWFVMQIAMLGGFLTAYPANAWLIRLGVKEPM
ncbi:DUF4396 domain-containing protein [Amnibacterium kyonggiense]|uniref:Uncharacterized protein DUF4396 n=1 Tax=Amnibacterium kyonggiense TaxID=595671 RepID=A0A4R7FIC9_9MICO|nr:DUF4396 domain-containing protein [Amnibacterium kyonggiense]TDS75801.1 uncharacterized protein DUF4396 [Amnibacterium kyonggiense]